MKWLGHACIVCILAVASNLNANGQEPGAATARRPTDRVPLVVFVCEHGSAKSVIAAAHFNRLAKERSLKVRAISFGTNPDPEISPKTAQGLQSDGLVVGRKKPKRLSRADVSRASRLVTFCALPDDYRKGVRVEQWIDIPSVSDDLQNASRRHSRAPPSSTR